MTISEPYTLDIKEYCRVYDEMEKRTKNTLKYFYEKNAISSDRSAEVVSSVIGSLLKNALSSVIHSTQLKIDQEMATAKISKMNAEASLVQSNMSLNDANVGLVKAQQEQLSTDSELEQQKVDLEQQKIDLEQQNADLDRKKVDSDNLQAAINSLNSAIGDYAIGGLVIPSEMTEASLGLIELLSGVNIETIVNPADEDTAAGDTTDGDTTDEDTTT